MYLIHGFACGQVIEEPGAPGSSAPAQGFKFGTATLPFAFGAPSSEAPASQAKPSAPVFGAKKDEAPAFSFWAEQRGRRRRGGRSGCRDGA